MQDATICHKWIKIKIMNSRIILFLLVSFGFSWAVATGLYFLPENKSALKGGLTFLYMCGPAIGALICAWRFNAGNRIAALGLRLRFNRWLFLAYLIGIILVMGSTALAFLFSDISAVQPVIGYSAILKESGVDVGNMLTTMPYGNLILIGQFLILAPLLNIPFMLSEELGWRGWLWHEMRPKGFWYVTLWTGLFWGIWHAPVIAMGHNYPDMPVFGPILFTAFCLLYSPIFSYIREKSGSVWGACILHGATNGAAALGLAIQSSIDLPWRGVVGIGGFVILCGFTLFVFYKKSVEKRALNPAAS
ncbi:CPBP family intramembrane glutamic endopeptidase [Litorimonas sp. RW-G-Af-16]|uniref:CPBP family intramembrane glutamic endopeptidase n=1 Tax=Litorimonas sp. RW-G-Af-16 TaxID=3241168 RepID=UPI00390CAB0F